MNHLTALSLGVAVLAALTLFACSSTPSDPSPPATRAAAAAEPPPKIQSWMDRLTVEHAYDPATGFIVAKETITLPAVLTEAPRLDEAIRQAGDGRTVIAFATADRCAPCQQFKKDALNDPAVIARLQQSDVIATHVEVDRDPELAAEYLRGAAIPMSYALRDGEIVATLGGQRSAAQLRAWLDEILEG